MAAVAAVAVPNAQLLEAEEVKTNAQVDAAQYVLLCKFRWTPTAVQSHHIDGTHMWYTFRIVVYAYGSHIYEGTTLMAGSLQK